MKAYTYRNKPRKKRAKVISEDRFASLSDDEIIRKVRQKRGHSYTYKDKLPPKLPPKSACIIS